MRSPRAPGLRAGQGGAAKEVALWTQASLLTVGSSLRSAGSSLFTGIRAGYEQLTHDHSDRERVTFVKFGRLHAPSGRRGEDGAVPVLLLAYAAGFQVWSLADGAVKELVSRREGRVTCLEPMPLPLEQDPARCPLLPAWPLLAVVTEEPAGAAEGGLPASCVRLYSLQSHSFVHSIAVPGRVLSLACSRRVLLVALAAQVMAYDTASLAVSYSAITYPAPCLRAGCGPAAVPLALGSRWLAHASNQPVQGASGVALAQPLGGGGGGGGGVEAVQAMASQAARSTGRQLKSMGEAGYRLLSSQMSWRGCAADGGGPPSSPGSSAGGLPEAPDVAGTVIVRDLVSRATVAHFRAHTSPLLLLRFDASGGLLVTASVHGHSINVFAVSRGSSSGGGGGGGGPETPAPAAHLFHLSRGLTPALIQDVGFSCCGRWLCCSSARGTTHVFRLALPGQQQDGCPPHLAAAALTDAQRRACQPVRLQAAGRARASGLLNGAIPGSAAASAAVGLYSGSAGSTLLAASFMPRGCEAGGGGGAEPLFQGAGIAEDLFVASDDGLLVRHRVSVAQPPAAAAALQAAAPPQQQELQPPASRPEAAAVLAVEPVEQWQVGRRLSWPEREEAWADGGDSPGAQQQPAAAAGQAQPWAAYAETSIPRAPGSGPPLWADSQFHILEMQTGAAASEAAAPGAWDGGEGAAQMLLRVEAVPTKRISAQGRAGLAPVIIEGQETAVVRGAHPRAL